MAESADRTTVTRTTGMRASIWRSCLKTSRPDWSGRRRSRRITSGRLSRARSRPSLPVGAISTRCAGAGNTWRIWSGSRSGSSSIRSKLAMRREPPVQGGDPDMPLSFYDSVTRRSAPCPTPIAGRIGCQGGDAMKSTQDQSPTALPGDGLVPLESILCTEELNGRPTRPRDYAPENRALASLARALAEAPRAVLQTLADTILEVFQAGSAGISLLTKEDGGKRFYWPAIAGMWKPHIGGGTPRDFGPCGDVLDRNVPLLFSHFERRYPYLLPVTPPAVECLLVPFYVEGKAVGTIWAITHDDRRTFDLEDLRQLVSLATFASSAYQVTESLVALDQQGETLRQSEERYRIVTQATNDAVWDWDLGTHKVWWNEGVLTLFGYRLDNSESDPAWWLERVHPEDRAGVEAFFYEVVRGKELTWVDEYRFRCADGSYKDVYDRGYVLRDPEGRAVRMIGAMLDITARKRAEQALRESEQRWRSLTEALPQLVWSATRDGARDYFSTQWTEYTGVPV